MDLVTEYANASDDMEEIERQARYARENCETIQAYREAMVSILNRAMTRRQHMDKVCRGELTA